MVYCRRYITPDASRGPFCGDSWGGFRHLWHDDKCWYWTKHGRRSAKRSAMWVTELVGFATGAQPSRRYSAWAACCGEQFFRLGACYDAEVSPLTTRPSFKAAATAALVQLGALRLSSAWWRDEWPDVLGCGFVSAPWSRLDLPRRDSA